MKKQRHRPAPRRKPLRAERKKPPVARTPDWDIAFEDKLEGYDALVPPEPGEWLEMDDTEKQILVEAYHEREGIEVPNMTVHAIMHTVVENQLADPNEARVRLKLAQLMGEGLDRHDAIHAIAAVLASYMNRILKSGQPVPQHSEPYYEALGRLTKESWYKDFGEEK